MLSLEPSIKRGLTFWDRALFPPDEFDERVRLVRLEMKRRGLAALVVAGNMYEDEDLVFLAGYNVDGVLVLPIEGDAAIFTNSGSRESFFLRELTWISDLSHRGAQTGQAVAETLRARGIVGGRIGTAGLQVLAAGPYRALMDGLNGYQVEDFTPAYRALRAVPRPRELAALRVALGIAEAAADAGGRVFAEGASNAEAVIEAERFARRAGAWDVRILANLDGDELRPLERVTPVRRPSFLMWIATRYQGLWGDATVWAPQTGGSDAGRAVSAMTHAARAGVSAQVVARAGLAELTEDACRSALAYGLGGSIGISLNASPIIAPDSQAMLAKGMLISFHVFARTERHSSIAASLVEIGVDGARRVTGALKPPCSAVSLP